MCIRDSAYPSYKEIISYFDSEKQEQIYEGISADIYKNEKAGIRISKFDFKKQDDAKRINFGTNDIYKFWEISSGSSEDLSYMINGSLELIMKVSSSSDPKIELSLQCYKNQNQINLTESKECYKSFDLSKLLNDEPNNWKKITMPLSCLDNKDFELSTITSRAKLATRGDWVIDIHSIKYKNNQASKACKLYSEHYE